MLYFVDRKQIKLKLKSQQLEFTSRLQNMYKIESNTELTIYI